MTFRLRQKQSGIGEIFLVTNAAGMVASVSQASGNSFLKIHQICPTKTKSEHRRAR